jgi:integrase
VKRRRDTGKWEVRWRENGRNRSKSFTAKADAQRFEMQVRRAREVGRPLDLDRGRETLAEFVGVFWRRYALTELSEKTRADYRGVWERHVRHRLGGYRLRDVTPAVVDEFRSELRLSGAGEATVAKALTLLSSMYRCAVTWDRVDVNPLREIRIPQAKRKRLVRPIPPSQVEAMRVALLAAGRRRDAVLLTMLAYAGLRPQEARALQWRDVGERTICVERAAAGSSIKATKTEELRTVRLLKPLSEDLASLRGDSSEEALVFPHVRGVGGRCARGGEPRRADRSGRLCSRRSSRTDRGEACLPESGPAVLTAPGTPVPPLPLLLWREPTPEALEAEAGAAASALAEDEGFRSRAGRLRLDDESLRGSRHSRRAGPRLPGCRRSRPTDRGTFHQPTLRRS